MESGKYELKFLTSYEITVTDEKVTDIDVTMGVESEGLGETEMNILRELVSRTLFEQLATEYTKKVAEGIAVVCGDLINNQEVNQESKTISLPANTTIQ